MDYLTKEGALRLAIKIKSYWKGKIDIWTEPINVRKYKTDRRLIYQIRSNMIGGRPR